MQRLLLGVGNVSLENAIQNTLNQDYLFVGTATFRDGLIDNIKKSGPDIILLQEKLKGSQEWSQLLYTIRMEFPSIRIIFLTGERQVGDEFMTFLVTYQIYDVISSKQITMREIVELIKHPRQLEHMKKWMPRFKGAVDISQTDVKVIPENKVHAIDEEDAMIPPRPTIPPVPPISQPVPQPKPKPKPKPKPAPPKVNTEPPVEVPVSPTEKAELDAKVKAKKPPKPAPTTPPKKPEKEVGRGFSFFKRDVEKLALADVIQGKNKVITFVGASGGVGNTQVALNTAALLAESGAKTCFIELKKKNPSIDFLYRLTRTLHHGLEYAIEGVIEDSSKKIKTSIIRSSELMVKVDTKDLMSKKYKHFPATLDFLLFSPEFRGQYDVLEKSAAFKELLGHLTFELGYQYIVLDIEADFDDALSEIALRFGSHVFITLTQEVYHISNAVDKVTDFINRYGIQEKLHYIVNKHDTAIMSVDKIQTWLQQSIDVVIPQAYTEFLNANYEGLPMVIHSNSVELKKPFYDLANYIIKK